MFIYKKMLVLFLVFWAGILSTHPDLVFSIHDPVSIHTQQSRDWLPVATQIVFDQKTSLPIVEKEMVDGEWSVSESAVSHLSSSGLPGQNANIILYSHNYPQLFGQLREMRLGEEFTLITQSGTQFSYKIVSKVQVDSDQVEWLRQTDHEVVTLYTCDGLFDQKRLVVRAVRVGV